MVRIAVGLAAIVIYLGANALVSGAAAQSRSDAVLPDESIGNSQAAFSSSPEAEPVYTALAAGIVAMVASGTVSEAATPR